MLWPMRVALTGRKASPGNFEVAEALGKTESLIRIKTAIELLKWIRLKNLDFFKILCYYVIDAEKQK